MPLIPFLIAALGSIATGIGRYIAWQATKIAKQSALVIAYVAGSTLVIYTAINAATDFLSARITVPGFLYDAWAVFLPDNIGTVLVLYIGVTVSVWVANNAIRVKTIIVQAFSN